VQADPSEFRALDLRVHALLADVPLHDVFCVELPGGGPGRTLADLPDLVPGAGASPGAELPLAARLLFVLRGWLGRLFGWDAGRHAAPAESFEGRLLPEDRERSLEPSGAARGAFRTLYRFDRESLLEVRNATVHAFLASALEPRTESDADTDTGGYQLFLAIYVRPVSRWTAAYMALIDPFRHWIVYPALIRRIERAWELSLQTMSR
jgi:hypothetical protein